MANNKAATSNTSYAGNEFTYNYSVTHIYLYQLVFLCVQELGIEIRCFCPLGKVRTQCHCTGFHKQSKCTSGLHSKTKWLQNTALSSIHMRLTYHIINPVGDITHPSKLGAHDLRIRDVTSPQHVLGTFGVDISVGHVQ